MTTSLVAQETGVVQLQGEPDLHNVTPLIAEGRTMIEAASGEWTLDLSSQSGHFSSAAVALLLDWLRLCEARGVSLRIINPPEQFGAMISICGLDDILTPLVAQA